MNRVEISGKLTRDPEIRFVGDRRFPILAVNVAVDDGTGRFNRDTKKQEYDSGFYQVEVIGQYAEALSTVLHKGDFVYVLGSLSQWRKVPKDGQGEGETKTRIQAQVLMPLTPAAVLGGGDGGIQPPANPLVDEPDPWATGDAPGWTDEPHV